MKQAHIHNRRYLGNKQSLGDFITKTVEDNCVGVEVVVDIFSGTGAVANMFKDNKVVITNDLLYCNYIGNCAWFLPQKYSAKKIKSIIKTYNDVSTNENNYMRQNFADTFYAADTCSKIGYIREDIETKYKAKAINFKEYAILITALMYGMDKIANTVGHYDAYRKNADYDSRFVIPLVLPEPNNAGNKCFNNDANVLIGDIKCDLLYLDPPYNSRQYSDAYHLLENMAKWEKPEVFGVARKMDRSDIKSDYCTMKAADAFAHLVENADAKYIMLSYNNISEKGNSRSNAKLSDDDIVSILSAKGDVKIFETEHRAFSTGKSNLPDNTERLFLCEVK